MQCMIAIREMGSHDGVRCGGVQQGVPRHRLTSLVPGGTAAICGKNSCPSCYTLMYELEEA